MYGWILPNLYRKININTFQFFRKMEEKVTLPYSLYKSWYQKQTKTSQTTNKYSYRKFSTKYWQIVLCEYCFILKWLNTIVIVISRGHSLIGFATSFIHLPFTMPVNYEKIISFPQLLWWCYFCFSGCRELK